MQKIVPFLWFDNNLEEAMNFYTGIFKSARVTDIVRHPPGGPGVEGSLLCATFYLEGQEFAAMNGGPAYKFNEAVSMYVKCNTQEEIDFLWERLLEGGGVEQACGWLKDKFGLSWQITPPILLEMMGDKDPRKAQNVMQAMMQMIKIDISKLKEAYNQA